MHYPGFAIKGFWRPGDRMLLDRFDLSRIPLVGLLQSARKPATLVVLCFSQSGLQDKKKRACNHDQAR